MSVLEINSTTHANNAMLIHVPDDGKTYDALFTISRYSEGYAITYVGVNIATGGSNSTTNPDLSIACYASMSGSEPIQFCVQNIKAGDVNVSTANKGSVSGANAYVNTLVSCMLSERVESGSGVQDVRVTGCL